MGAPATQGRLCLKLAEMEIGDYIRCTYTAPTENVAGEFSDFGGVVEEVEELPIEPGTTANGYFYYLKVDKGLLVADRKIQKNISGKTLLANGYLEGKNIFQNKLIRILSQFEWTRYLTEGDCQGNVEKQDVAVWHSLYYSPSQPNNTYFSVEIELLQDKRNNSIKTAMNLDGMALDSTHHAQGVYISNPWIFSFVPIFVGMDKVNVVDKYAKGEICFRPALEYIDNQKSKTIWY